MQPPCESSRKTHAVTTLITAKKMARNTFLNILGKVLPMVAVGLPLTYLLILYQDIEGAALARVLRVLFEFILIFYVIKTITKINVHATTTTVVIIGFCSLIMAFLIPLNALIILSTILCWIPLSLAFWNYALTSSERMSLVNVMVLPSWLVSRLQKSDDV